MAVLHTSRTRRQSGWFLCNDLSARSDNLEHGNAGSSFQTDAMSSPRSALGMSLAAAVLLIGSPIAAQSVGKLHDVDGQVTIHRGESIEATEGASVVLGDTVATAHGASATIELTGGGEIRLYDESRIAVRDTLMQLLLGRARSIDARDIIWTAGDMNLAARRTDFMMVVADDEVVVGVKEGEILASKGSAEGILLRRHLMARTERGSPSRALLTRNSCRSVAREQGCPTWRNCARTASANGCGSTSSPSSCSLQGSPSPPISLSNMGSGAGAARCWTVRRNCSRWWTR